MKFQLVIRPKKNSTKLSNEFVLTKKMKSIFVAPKAFGTKEQLIAGKQWMDMDGICVRKCVHVKSGILVFGFSVCNPMQSAKCPKELQLASHFRAFFHFSHYNFSKYKVN